MSTLTYNTIQYSPTHTGEVSVNLGVLVNDREGGRWLSLLSPDLIERRCKMLTTSAPPSDNVILDDLRDLARRLGRLGGDSAIDFTATASLPPILQNPERYNNQIRISPPNAVVYGSLRETAEFLLRALAPVETPEPKTRVVTQIRRRYDDLINQVEGLRSHTMSRPVLNIGKQRTALEFAFTAGKARMLVQAFNFDRHSGLDALQNQVNSLNYFVHKARIGKATLSDKKGPQQAVNVPESVAFDVIFRRPSRKNRPATELFNSVTSEWEELLIRPVPDDEAQGSVKLASELVLP